MIVDSQSNLPLNLINENAPLAKALLNAAVGDETPLEIKGVIRLLRVLKIERQAELALE
jgi:transcription elongation GreA/GreB family factor